MTTMGEDLYEEGRGEERVKVARNLLLLGVDKTSIMRATKLTSMELAEIAIYVDDDSMTNAELAATIFDTEEIFLIKILQERLSEEGEKIVLGAAESFRIKGREEARKELTKNLLLLSFDKATIMQVIEIGQGELEEIIEILL